jgi:superfamily II DNA or RNA helicase
MNPQGLLPRQVPVAEHLIKCLAKHRAAVDTSDTGVGKMYVGASIVRELNVPTLVVAPKSILSKWHDVAAHFGTELSAINYEMVRTGRTPFGTWVPSKNGKGKWFQWADEVDFLLFDEGHYASGMKSQNAALMFSAARQNKITLVTSATLAESPLKMRAIGFLLGLHRGNDFYGWARRNGCKPGAFGGFVYRGGPEGMAKIHRAIFPEKGVRVRVEDIPDFPETQITCELCDVENPAKADKLYAEMAAQIAALHSRAQHDKGGPLSEILRAHQELELLMVPPTVEMAKNAIEEGHSVPIFCNYRETIYAIAEKLGTPCVLHGDISPEDRDITVALFQSDKERAVVCQAEVGGVGLGFHDLNGRYPRYSLILPGHRAITVRQNIGRVWRTGGLTKSFQRILFPASKLGRRIHRTVSAKLDNLDALNDADLQPENLKLA